MTSQGTSSTSPGTKNKDQASFWQDTARVSIIRPRLLTRYGRNTHHQPKNLVLMRYGKNIPINQELLTRYGKNTHHQPKQVVKISVLRTGRGCKSLPTEWTFNPTPSRRYCQTRKVHHQYPPSGYEPGIVTNQDRTTSEIRLKYSPPVAQYLRPRTKMSALSGWAASDPQ